MSLLITLKPQASASGITGMTIDMSTGDGLGFVYLYEVWVEDKDGVDQFEGLTAQGAAVSTFGGLSAGEFTTDSPDVPATDGNLNNDAPTHYDVTNSSGGSGHYAYNGGTLKLHMKFASEIQLSGGGKIVIAYRNNTGKDYVNNTTFLDQDGNEVTPTASPADMNDGLQSSATANMTMYTWQF